MVTPLLSTLVHVMENGLLATQPFLVIFILGEWFFILIALHPQMNPRPRGT